MVYIAIEFSVIGVLFVQVKSSKGQYLDERSPRTGDARSHFEGTGRYRRRCRRSLMALEKTKQIRRRHRHHHRRRRRHHHHHRRRCHRHHHRHHRHHHHHRCRRHRHRHRRRHLSIYLSMEFI